MVTTELADAIVQRPIDSSFAAAIDALANPLRDVVLLRDVGGLSARAIGDALGIGRAQAQVALLQARRAVRQRLVQPSTSRVALAAVRL
jgi:DNA-directed RNA polymerase specialized sigma24 family protein